MINVIGLGYIGLPTALMLASHGVEVVGTDYNKELVATLNAGKTTFKEKGLDELFETAVSKGIKFSTEYQVTDTYIVSVPTPYDKFSKKVDACYVVSAVKEILKRTAYEKLRNSGIIQNITVDDTPDKRNSMGQENDEASDKTIDHKLTYKHVDGGVMLVETDFTIK